MTYKLVVYPGNGNPIMFFEGDLKHCTKLIQSFNFIDPACQFNLTPIDVWLGG